MRAQLSGDPPRQTPWSLPSSPFPATDVTEPADWDRWAATLEPLVVDAGRVTVVAPHPDDETFGCGGLIADLVTGGAAVTVVTASDGSASHPGRAGLAEHRRAEQRAAVAALGSRTGVVWVGLPDGALGRHEEALRAQLRALAAGSDLVVAPWPGDRHPDHETAGRVAAEVADELGIAIVSYPVWLWRWGAPADLAGARCRRWSMSDAANRAKRSAMACFPTQTSPVAGAVIVDGAMLERFARPFEVYLDG